MCWNNITYFHETIIQNVSGRGKCIPMGPRDSINLI